MLRGELEYDAHFAFTVQEETGTTGAKTAQSNIPNRPQFCVSSASHSGVTNRIIRQMRHSTPVTWFLRHAGGRSAEGEKPLIARVFPSREMLSAPILRQDRPCDLEPANRQIVEAERLSDVFGLLCKSDPQFAKQAHYTAWLADVAKTRRVLPYPPILLPRR